MKDLAGFSGRGYDKGRSRVWQALWLLVQSSVFQRWWMPARWRVTILRAFGAKIGSKVLIRHRVRIHWPWKLSIGNASWIGEGVWILNLEPVVVGRNVCVSQGVLICTGSHDYGSQTFEYDNGPIEVCDGVWLGARSIVLRGVTVGANSVVGASALVTRDVRPDSLLLAPEPVLSTLRSLS